MVHDVTTAATAEKHGATAYRAARMAHWDGVARSSDGRADWGAAYRRRLAAVYGQFILPGQRVLEVGTGLGDLIGALGSTTAVGVDFAPEMIRRARARHPGVTFIEADAHALSRLEGPFDVVVLSDLVNDLWDVQAVFEQI